LSAGKNVKGGAVTNADKRKAFRDPPEV